MGLNTYNITTKKPNIKKATITAIIGIILVVSDIVWIYNKVKIEIIKNSTYQYINEIKIQKINIEEKQTEEKRIKDEEQKNKYAPLTPEEMEKLDNIYKHHQPKRVLLTFDDGPTNEVTPFILDTLKEQNIKANFCVLGTMVENNPSILKRVYEEGHFIANHGYTHKYKEIYKTPDSVYDEYNRTNQAIKNAIGNENFNSLIFRFPGGSYGGPYDDIKKIAKQKLKENGISSIDWNALTNDAEGSKTKEEILSSLHETTKDKTSIVLLMHDAPDKILTYETLNDVINYFKENGYNFETFFDVIGR